MGMVVDEAITSPEDPCEQPFAVSGPCKMMAPPSFSFNKGEGKCEQFFYGGCEGNNNNFGSLAACQDKCEAASTTEPNEPPESTPEPNDVLEEKEEEEEEDDEEE